MSSKRDLSAAQQGAHLRVLVDQSSAITWSTDAGLNLTSTGGGGLGALGQRADQLEGTSLQQLFETQDDHHPAIAGHRRALGGEPVKYEVEWQGRWWENYVQPLREAGAIVGTIGMAIDVTERKQAEQASAALEQRLRHKYKLEAIGQLASGLAHEINNPLQSVMNFAQLIRSRAEPGPLREYATEIVNEAQRIAASVRNLQSFVHQEGELPVEIRVNDLVLRTLSLFRSALQKENIALELSIPEDLPPVWGRVHVIQQVLVNLLTAGREAVSGPQPADDERKRICVSAKLVARAGEAALRLTIEEHGTAIREQDLPRVFEPFAALDGRDHGAGLGQAVSHGLAGESGGALSVESEAGRPTRFHLDLPLAAER